MTVLKLMIVGLFVSGCFNSSPPKPRVTAVIKAKPQLQVKEHKVRATKEKSHKIGKIQKADYSIVDIYSKRKELKDKTISVRGRVTKFSPMILGTNWVHLKDGTGKVKDKTDDLIITTKDFVKVGDKVLAKGLVTLDKRVGNVHFFKVVLSDAKLKVE